MPLSSLHVINVCKFSTDKQCKYLETDDFVAGQFNCLKQTVQKDLIDKIMDGAVKNLSHNPRVLKATITAKVTHILSTKLSDTIKKPLDSPVQFCRIPLVKNDTYCGRSCSHAKSLLTR